MSLKEKIAERKLNNEIQDVLYGLHIEATEDFSYIKNSSELEILKESQKYAKILYDIINFVGYYICSRGGMADALV